MKTLKKEIEEHSRDVLLDCGCCMDDYIKINILFEILKKRGINLDEEHDKNKTSNPRNTYFGVSPEDIDTEEGVKVKVEE